MLYLWLILCAALGAWLVYRYDMYEREPWCMLLLAAGLGFGAMWLLGFLEPWTLRQWGPPPRPDAVVAAVAATHEEIARLLLVAGLALVLPRQLNDPMDGLVYGSVVGLGMAIEESLFYLGLGSTGGHLLPRTEVIRLFGHLVLGGITCFGVGLARLGRRGWPAWLLGGAGLSMALHFAWDMIAFAAWRQGTMRTWQTVAAVSIMTAGMLVYGRLVALGARWSREHFDPDSRHRLWGWPFARAASDRGQRGP